MTPLFGTPALGERVDPSLLVVVADAPRDVVHGACALPTRLAPAARRARSIRHGSRRATSHVVSSRLLRTHQPLEHRLGSGRARAVRAHAVEPLERELGGDLGMLGDQRRIRRRCSRRPRGRGLRSRRRRASPRRRSVSMPSAARRASQKSIASSDATRQTMRWTLPAPARPEIALGYSKNVRSAPGGPLLAVEQVVDVRIVLVHGLRDQRSPTTRV